MMRFSGKVAFITGGAMGFGRAFAKALGKEGASICVADIDIPTAEQTVKDLTASGIKAIAVNCDVGSNDAVQAAVRRAIAELGGIDILINNAGKHLTRFSRPFIEQPVEQLRLLFEVNMMGLIYCTLACRETMKARGGGSIVNISSISSYFSLNPYGVSKLAVRGLTSAFAGELGPDGTRVNAIAPGLMATEAAMEDQPKEKIDRFVNELQHIKRLGTMDDVVSTLLFLCSKEASFITGETIRVSGGYPYGI